MILYYFSHPTFPLLLAAVSDRVSSQNSSQQPAAGPSSLPLRVGKLCQSHGKQVSDMKLQIAPIEA